jgi:hypothetical protein
VDKNTTVVFPAPLMTTIAELGSFLAREQNAATPVPPAATPVLPPTSSTAPATANGASPNGRSPGDADPDGAAGPS